MERNSKHRLVHAGRSTTNISVTVFNPNLWFCPAKYFPIVRWEALGGLLGKFFVQNTTKEDKRINPTFTVLGADLPITFILQKVVILD